MLFADRIQSQELARDELERECTAVMVKGQGKIKKPFRIARNGVFQPGERCAA
ncbi:MAG TPA: hypothetical protein VKY92_03670 [Verrucomicrobiae bacterium]|nr:hypothetical protein [Verrucomicrobiae bacterium]